MRSLRLHRGSRHFSSRLFVIAVLLSDFCLTPGLLRGDTDTAKNWQILGLIDASHNAELNVRTQALLRLAKTGSLPSDLLEAGDGARTIRDLLNSTFYADIQNGLTLAVQSKSVVAKNEARIRELLSASDSDIVLLAAKALGSAGLIKSDDSPAIAKLLSSSPKNSGEAALLLSKAHLLTPEYGRQMAAALRNESMREYSSVVDNLVAVQMLKQEDVAFLLERAKVIDPSTDFYRYLDLAKAIVKAGGATTEFTASFTRVLQIDPHSTTLPLNAMAAIRVLDQAGPAALPILRQLADSLSTSDLNGAQVKAVLLAQTRQGSELAAPFFRQFVRSQQETLVYFGLVELNELHQLQDGDKAAALELLRSKDSKIVLGAAAVLKALNVSPNAYRAALIDRLPDAENEVFLGMLDILGSDKGLSPADVDKLISLFDKRSGPYEQVWAAKLICNNNALPTSVVSRLENLVATGDLNTALPAVVALTQCKAATAAQAELLAARFHNVSGLESSSLANVLGTMGPIARSAAPLLANNLSIDRGDRFAKIVAQATETSVDGDRVRALEAMGPHDIATLSVILSQAAAVSQARAELIAIAYELAGHQNPGLLLIRALYDPPTDLDHDARIERLSLLLSVWNHTTDADVAFRDQLAHGASLLVRGESWSSRHDELLRDWIAKLKASHHLDEADVFERALDATAQRDRIIKLALASLDTLIGHFVLWTTLLFFYVRSKWVRAFFFWSPFVRKFLGFGYVGFLLTIVPSLRRIVFLPFRMNLLSSAALEGSDLERYFEKRWALRAGKSIPESLDSAIPCIAGHILLEGDSGIGKSIFLRRLLKESKSPTVFLRAVDCTKGPVVAIQSKLQGLAADKEFLKRLIYVGAIDIGIDGLNEASPDTRAKIMAFLDEFSAGNVILTTQSIELDYTGPMRRFTLQPLSEKEINEFLLMQVGNALSLPSSHSVVVDRIDAYLKHVLPEDRPADQRKMTLEVLSNPFDLSVVAHLLATGHHPQLFDLVQQEVALAEADFTKIHRAELSIDDFSEAVYQSQSLGDELAIGEKFPQEAECLRKYRLIVPDLSGGTESTNWTFRHERIRNYFVAKAMLNKKERLKEGLRNPKLRGAYMVLATALPRDEAIQLKEVLVDQAVENNDIATLRDFVRRLGFRETPPLEAGSVAATQ